MQTQICQTPVLLMTKAGQAGLSINNLNLYKLGMVLDEGMSPESMMQYGSRFRKVLNPLLDIFIAVNTDSNDAMDKFRKRVASNPVFVVADQIEDETASVYKLKKAIGENDDDIVQPILDGLIAKRRIHKDTTLEEIKDGSALSRVRVAQTIEQRRRLFYHWHLGALIRDTHFGIDVSDALEHVDTSNVIELKEAKAQRTKAKREAKERYFKELVSVGYSKPEMFDQPWLTTAHARAFEEAETVYEAMKADGANRELMTLLWLNFKVKNIKKYNSFGKLFVKYQGEYQKLVATANDVGLVGMTFSAKEYQEVIQGWLNAVSNGFVSFLATEKKAKRQLFETVFKVKRAKNPSGGERLYKVIAVMNKARTRNVLTPIDSSEIHGFRKKVA
ncbi:hypothetical protein GA076_19095 [Vibrio parahaemolyticus]|nr:hypothetical protein [Vibrio parahaemolyticus]EHR0760550.1 hypothetical protein [Vibrio parahaemolyticus]EHR0831257.1 hypothetical protein [Vibrio parahaemolyticus]EHR1158874.1 hypothetical protein [Vibrio parahaemolyticus]EHR5011057.1 hypothetical protein [Vibrio parahaemolyticus]